MPLVLFFIVAAAIGAGCAHGCHAAINWQKAKHEELKEHMNKLAQK